MTDTLKDRAEKFRNDWPQERLRLPYSIGFRKDLIAEIKWARENPPMDNKENWPMAERTCFREGWVVFADHLMACLGEK